MRGVADQFIEEKRTEGLSARHLDNLRTNLDRFCTRHGKDRIAGITADAIDPRSEHLRVEASKTGRAPPTCRRKEKAWTGSRRACHDALAAVLETAGAAPIHDGARQKDVVPPLSPAPSRASGAREQTFPGVCGSAYGRATLTR